LFLKKIAVSLKNLDFIGYLEIQTGKVALYIFFSRKTRAEKIFYLK